MLLLSSDFLLMISVLLYDGVLRPQKKKKFEKVLLQD